MQQPGRVRLTWGRHLLQSHQQEQQQQAQQQLDAPPQPLQQPAQQQRPDAPPPPPVRSGSDLEAVATLSQERQAQANRLVAAHR